MENQITKAVRVKVLLPANFIKELETSILGWFARAISSEVEHYLDTVGVTGSIPVSPIHQ